MVTDDDLDHPADYPVTLWGLYQMVQRVDRRAERMEQTQKDTILPELKALKEEQKSLRNRWVYALTMIAASGSAALYMFVRAGGQF